MEMLKLTYSLITENDRGRIQLRLLFRVNATETTFRGNTNSPLIQHGLYI